MPIDPRTPVVIGVGQFLQRDVAPGDALDPIELMERAARSAADDAGLGGPPTVQSIRVVNLLSWRYVDPARSLGERLGIAASHHGVTTMGGNSPQSLMNRTCAEISDGRLDSALLAGGEAWRTRMRARREGVELTWGRSADGEAPEVLGTELEMNLDAETALGIHLPIQVYPMFETALRAHDGAEPPVHLARIAEMWAGFSEVAARNPYAWRREALTADEIGTPSPTNRMVGAPYTKVMNSNNDVDMAAALLVCSVAEAQRLGVPADRWVFPQSGTDCHEHPFISNRLHFFETPAIAAGGRMALELAHTAIDGIDLLDLYSCFPSAVQLGARSLGIDPHHPDRPLTLTGGLSFAGGPWNNYVMHAIATLVTKLRDEPEQTGLIWANGGYATKHAFGVYRARPPEEGFRSGSPQDAIDALPQRAAVTGAEAAGPATVEAYTVMHDRDGGPQQSIAACLLADGQRAWGVSDDSAVGHALLAGEWVGRSVVLDDAGGLHLP